MLPRHLRQLATRVLTWAVVCFLTLSSLPVLYRRWTQRTPSPIPIILTELDKSGLPECSLVASRDLMLLQNRKEFSIYTFHTGHFLGAEEELSNPALICVIVTVPQSVPETEGIIDRIRRRFQLHPRYTYLDPPVEGDGPDLIHLYLNSTNVRVPIPPLKPFPSQPSVELQQAVETILYFAELELHDAGTYDISAEREFKNWRWAKQGFIHDKWPSDVEPIALANIFPQKIVVSEQKNLHLGKQEQTRCSTLNGFQAHKGRWYRQAEYPHLAAGLTDEWGFVFSPDECALDYFSDVDVVNCLAGKTLHVFGDSNARRLTRALISAGRWCHDPLSACQKEDWGDDVFKATWDPVTGTLENETEPLEHERQFEVGDRQPYLWGKNATLYFSFIEAIVMTPNDWLAEFYSQGNFTLAPDGIPFNPAQISPGARARRPPDVPKPDLVVVGIGAWDEALDWFYADFAQTVPCFRDALLEAYPASETKLALRLGQGYCCRRNWTQDLRRFSGSRIAKFRDIVRNAWEIENGWGLGGRVAILDASGMTGRPEVVNDYGPTATNHQRAAHTRLEAQILLNYVCTRDYSGNAIWKEAKLETVQ